MSLHINDVSLSNIFILMYIDGVVYNWLNVRAVGIGTTCIATAVQVERNLGLK